MLLQLSGRDLRPLSEVSPATFVARVSERSDCSPPTGTNEVLLVRRGVAAPASGYRAYLFTDEAPPIEHIRDAYALSTRFSYLRGGDVVRIEPLRNAINVLYRRDSISNTFLVTERCDNYCLMCSQPPKERDDSWLLDELNEVIPLISPDTREIGITGGEPSLLGERLVELVRKMQNALPATAVHVLSNGRGFKNAGLACQLGNLRHPDLMVGIPLYSDVAEEHDYIVQARGAFDETLRGILNLKRHRVRVEIRFVIHAESYRALPTLARFIARNLLFVDHVALMGLEQMGFGRSNLETLWIDPLDYQVQLAEAVRTLDRDGLFVSIYNHQLCVLRPELHRFAHASISDWKNAYVEECNGCKLRDQCGGFFASSTTHRSRGIARVTAS